jgi:hypothetical protein
VVRGREGVVIRRSGRARSPAYEDVENNGKIQEAAPRRNVRDVGYPELIRRLRGKVTLDEIRSRPRIAITDRCHDRLASQSTVNATATHQARDTLRADSNAFFGEFGMNAWTAVCRARSLVDRFDAIRKQHIALLMNRERSRRPRVESASGYLQHTTHRAYRIFGLVRFHEREDLFGSSMLFRANQAAAFDKSQRGSELIRSLQNGSSGLEKEREPTWLATLHKVSPPSGPEPRPAPVGGSACLGLAS